MGNSPMHLPSLGHSLFIDKLAVTSPLLGGLLILLAVDSPNGAWNDVFRIVISIVLGVFVTLVGMLYHNLENRIKKIEDFSITRYEFKMSQDPLIAQLGRIEKHLENIDMRAMRGK
jgi:hypothetical protein